MTHYQRLIGDILATTDPALTALVEEFMRLDLTGLDGLSPEQFAADARQAHRDVVSLFDMGELDNICRAYQIPVPDLTNA